MTSGLLDGPWGTILYDQALLRPHHICTKVEPHLSML
jgi:hypothetical protein